MVKGTSEEEIKHRLSVTLSKVMQNMNTRRESASKTAAFDDIKTSNFSKRQTVSHLQNRRKSRASIYNKYGFGGEQSYRQTNVPNE